MADNALTQTALRQTIGDAGFEIVDERVFGTNPHGPKTRPALALGARAPIDKATLNEGPVGRAVSGAWQSGSRRGR